MIARCKNVLSLACWLRQSTPLTCRSARCSSSGWEASINTICARNHASPRAPAGGRKVAMRSKSCSWRPLCGCVTVTQVQASQPRTGALRPLSSAWGDGPDGGDELCTGSALPRPCGRAVSRLRERHFARQVWDLGEGVPTENHFITTRAANFALGCIPDGCLRRPRGRPVGSIARARGGRSLSD